MDHISRAYNAVQDPAINAARVAMGVDQDLEPCSDSGGHFLGSKTRNASETRGRGGDGIKAEESE
jgi:hypothetical protein